LPDDGIGQALLPSAASTTGKSAALKLVVLAFAAGLLLGVAIAYLRAYRRRVFTDARDPELVLGAPLLSDLSTIGLDDLLIHRSTPERSRVDKATEAMFAIAANLAAEQLPEIDERGVSLAIVDTENDAGCGAVAWRLALAYSTHDLRVLLIAADGSWSPPPAYIAYAADRYTWTEHADGTAALSDWCSLASIRSAVSKARNNGRTVAGPPISFCTEPPVRSQRALNELFRSLEHDYDVVLVNAAPFMSSAAASSLTSAAGRALAVVRTESGVAVHEELARRLRLAAAVPIGYMYCGRDARVSESWPGPNFAELRPPASAAGPGGGVRPEDARPSRSGWAAAFRSDS
jgi:Mrp family chromosome partitioning ATPase